MPFRPDRLLLPLLLAGLLAGCNEPPAGPALDRALVGAPEGALVASVNGEPVTEPMLLVYARGRGLDPAVPAQRQQALDSLVENILLAQYGIEAGLTGQEQVQAELALVRMQQLSGRAVSHLRSTLEVSDEQVADYYRQEAERAGDTEWQIEHILLADRAAAEVALARAREPGADFAALMQEYAGSARQARALDWSNATQLPPELAVALRQLADGEVAPVAIETSFGWHVLRRAASRPFAPPPLEQVREGARKQLLDRAMADHVAALKAKATIAAPGASDTPAAPEASATPAAPAPAEPATSP